METKRISTKNMSREDARDIHKLRMKSICNSLPRALAKMFADLHKRAVIIAAKNDEPDEVDDYFVQLLQGIKKWRDRGYAYIFDDQKKQIEKQIPNLREIIESILITRCRLISGTALQQQIQGDGCKVRFSLPDYNETLFRMMKVSAKQMMGYIDLFDTEDVHVTERRRNNEKIVKKIREVIPVVLWSVMPVSFETEKDMFEADKIIDTSDEEGEESKDLENLENLEEEDLENLENLEEEELEDLEEVEEVEEFKEPPPPPPLPPGKKVRRRKVNKNRLS